MQLRIQPSSELLGYYRFSLREIEAVVSLREADVASFRMGDRDRRFPDSNAHFGPHVVPALAGRPLKTG